KWLVTMDPLDTETSRFWQNHGEHNDVDTAKIQTEVIQLPTTCFAQDAGPRVNSGRRLQRHRAGGTPRAEGKDDIAGKVQSSRRLWARSEKEGGALRDQIVNLTWHYKDPGDPTPEELAREINGSALQTVTDPNDPTKVILQQGKQLPGFAALRDDGTTACPCWIYSGCFTEAGNLMARRDNNDPDEAGIFPNWTYSCP